MAECVFCVKTAEDDVDGWDRFGLVANFVPLNPVVPGHRLFVPKLHVAYAPAEPVITGYVFEVASRYGAEQPEHFNLITSAGAAATQTVEHLHVHYVPRKPDDGLALPWTGQRR